MHWQSWPVECQKEEMNTISKTPIKICEHNGGEVKMGVNLFDCKQIH